MSTLGAKKKMVLFPKRSILSSWNEEKQSLFLKFAKQKQMASKQELYMEKYAVYSNRFKKKSNCN